MPRLGGPSSLSAVIACITHTHLQLHVACLLTLWLQRPRSRSHSMRSLLPCVTQPSHEDERLSASCSPPGSSPRRRHLRASTSSSGSRHLRRAVSDVNIKSNNSNTVFKTISQGSTPTNSKGTLRRMDS